jgi:predicted N-formylglutamate amidohydrolase
MGPVHRPFDVVISCEHASNAVPPEVDLGLPADILETHVAWDPGAHAVATLLARALGAPVFLGEWTRLLVDLNRSPWNPEVVPTVAFDVPVPGNQGLDTAARAARMARYHTPYWRRVQDEITARLARSPEARVLHLSIHSFTGEFRGEVRPMSMGIMMDPALPLEREAGDILLAELTAQGVHAVENQPYDGRADALCTSCRPVFGHDHYAGLEIELSQNHLDEIEALGQRLLQAVQALRLR